MAILGTPQTHPPAAEAPTALATHSPVITTVYGEQVTAKRRALYIRSGAVAIIQLPVFDANGNPIDLATVTTIQAKVCEATRRRPGVSTVTGAVVLYTDSTVQFDLPKDVTSKAGIYLIDVGLLDGDARLMQANTVFLFNEHSSWGSTHRQGPPALDDIRLSLRDNDPIENELINAHDTDIAEICAAAIRVVEFWNDTPPILSRHTYSTITFPFREIWLTGIQLFLFQMLEEHYRRNVLPYSAGGVSTDDKNRHKEYGAAWQQRFQQYQKMVMMQKVRLNMLGGYGSFLSGYPG